MPIGYTSHRMSKTPEYRAWSDMRRRCADKENLLYGGRGITVCDRWLESFESFMADMGLRPSDGHSLDRIDANGNYEPSNCRWATITEQNRNLRANRRLEWKGEVRCLSEWSEVTGLPYGLIYDRLDAGWTTEAALTTPAIKKNTVFITFQGRTQSVAEWARELNVSFHVLANRKKAGWSDHDVISKPGRLGALKKPKAKSKPKAIAKRRKKERTLFDSVPLMGPDAADPF